MPKVLYFTFLFLPLCFRSGFAQSCEFNAVNATVSSCSGNYFSVSLDIETSGEISPGFTLAGNGVIYGTYLYTDLPVTVGPLLGDDESAYEFIAWDVENPACQSFTIVPAANCGPICSFSDFVLDSTTCVSMQIAIVVFDFVYDNPSGNTFDLLDQNGDKIGTWLYSSLPVTFPFFQVNGAAPIELTVCDHNNPDCCETFTLPAIDCSPNNCEIFSVTATPQCTGNNFLVHLDFGYDNPPSDSFSVTGNMLNYGKFAYTQLPVTLGPLNGSSTISWQFDITDSEMPSCSGGVFLGTYTCPPPCNILALEALALECDGNDAFSLMLGLDIEGEGDSGFAVFSESYYYGNYSYNALPLVLPSWQSDCSFIDQVSVCDNDNLGCCTTMLFEALQCCGCLIYNLTATALPCNENGEIFVEIDFDYNNVSADGFEITGNGNHYGQFLYELLPVQIGPFLGDGSQYFEFVVTDLEDAFCFEAVELGFIACPDICLLSDMTVDLGECTGYHSYSVTIDFEHQAVSPEGFDLFVNDTYFATYSYDDLPLTILNLPSGGGATDAITVCDKGVSSCCTSLTFDAVSCECGITGLSTSVTGCITEETFGASIGFAFENLPSPLVDIFFDGILIGTFNPANQPIQVQLPEGVGTGLLSVCANDLPGCCDQEEIEKLLCEFPECGIVELVALPGECNSTSTFELAIAFDTLHFPGTGVTVTANGQAIGQFEVPAEQLLIEFFPVLGPETALVICAADDPECCADYVFATPDCSTFGQCAITNLTTDTGLCTSDSTYILHLVFDYANLTGDSVIITANGQEVATTSVNEGHVIIQNFPVQSTSNTFITVCDVNTPECCDQVEIVTPDCSTFGQCSIYNLFAEPGDCNSDSTFLLDIVFDTLFFPGTDVVIYAGGEEVGIYQVEPDFIRVQFFPVTGPLTFLTVCAADDPECCAEFEFETPDCSTFVPCGIFNLNAEAGECTSTTSHILSLDFEYQQLTSNFVMVRVNGDPIVVTGVNGGHIFLESFPVVATGPVVVSVCDINNTACCDSDEAVFPDCSTYGQCIISNLTGEPSGCTSDSTFLLHLGFTAQFLPDGDSVAVTANGVLIGHFKAEDDGVTITHFPVPEIPETVIEICAVGDTACCAQVTIIAPDCSEPTCFLYDLVAGAGPCTSDSTYIVEIAFEAFNLSSDSVWIYTNGAFIGQFGIDPESLRITDFPVVTEEETTIVVCAAGDPECCDTVVIATPFCGVACAILEIGIDVIGCNSDSTFASLVSFTYQGTASDSFAISAGGHFLGTFSGNDLPAVINSFPSNQTGQYTVTVCEQGNGDCCASFDFEGPVCDPEACDIFNLTFEQTPCDSADQFYIILNFDVVNPGENGFTVVGNGNHYGTFSYENLPVQIGPFGEDGTVIEFQVADVDHPECDAVIVPGIRDCTVSTTPVSPELFFDLHSNGSIPVIQALNRITLTAFHINGNQVMRTITLSPGQRIEFSDVPAGMYIAIIRHENYMWPVKLVKM